MQNTKMRVGFSRGRSLWSGALFVLLAGCLTAATSAQQIYGWTDSNGVVTYSNLPPPKGVKVTDVIPDKPLSPASIQEAARRSEIDALNDRIRLLELEQARSKREVVDYVAEPAQPLTAGCSMNAYGDCSSDWAPYYTSGFLYGTGERRHRDNGNGNRRGEGPGHPAHTPIHVGPPAPVRLAPIAASPNRSSLQPH